MLACIVLGAACAAPEGSPSPEGQWVGEITTQGEVTTVFNQSGSVWGGVATLVEEASIGAESGPEELVFGDVAWVFASVGTIYVIDPRAPAVRRYAHDGTPHGILGQSGEGPGGYTSPYRLALAPDGRIFVSDPAAEQINVYGADGAPLDTWSIRMSTVPPATLVVDAEGVLWAPVDPADMGGRPGIQALPDGTPGERVLIEEFAGRPLPADGGQGILWTPGGGGELIVGVSGAGAYRFEIQRRGRAAVVVERAWEPIPVNPEFAAWFLQVYGRERPPTLPPYVGFTKAASGEIWVTRPTNAHRVAGCHEDLSDVDAARENPCWVPAFGVDVFGADGRYLGEVEMPDDIAPFAQWMHVDGEMLVARSLQNGVFRVKRFRIVLPNRAEEEP